MICLTQNELKEFTGYARPNYISKWLRNNDITFLVGADGWPRVATEHFNQRMNTTVSSKTLKKSEPNLQALMERQRAAQKNPPN